jgi:iron complex transport system substrate-binding protein
VQVSRRHFTLAAAGGLTTISLAACGTEEEPAASSTPSSAAAEPVTVEHTFGTATFETTPARIVAMSSQWIDALLALGVTPVGYVGTPMGGDDRQLYPWESGMPADAELIPASADGTVSVEQVAALTPDMILGDWSVTADNHAQFEAIAPTIVQLSDAQVDKWEDQLTVLGEVLRLEADAQAVVEETYASVDEVAQEYPGLQGRTFALAQYVFSSQQLVVVADPEDGASDVFRRLGMTLPEPLVAAAAGAGRAMLSPEQVDLLSADLVVFLPNGGTEADLATIPGWTDLPSVVSGGMVYVDYATVVGFNTPSALSISAVLQTIDGGLAAVAGS